MNIREQILALVTKHGPQSMGNLIQKIKYTLGILNVVHTTGDEVRCEVRVLLEQNLLDTDRNFNLILGDPKDNTMNKQLNITIDLTPDDIKEAITLYLAQQLNNDFPGTKRFDIEFDVSKQLEGYGQAEQEVVRFRGASVKVTPNV